MRKVLLAFSIAAISFGTANAQKESSVKFGLKAGVNFSNARSTTSGTTTTEDMKVGFHVGALANLPVSSEFSINPEVVYSAEGAKEKGSDAKINLGYINVPVMAQYNTASGFFVETGPQIGFLLSAKAKANGVTQDVKDAFTSTNFSWGLGAGYKVASGLGFNARYNLGLSNIEKNPASGDKTKASTIQVSVFKLF